MQREKKTGQSLNRRITIQLILLIAVIATIVSIWAGVDTLSWQKLLASALVVGGVILVSRSRAAGIIRG